MAEYNYHKTQVVISYLRDSHLKFKVNYPISESLWSKLDELEIPSELDKAILSSCLLYLGSKIYQENSESDFSLAPYKPVPLQSAILKQILGQKYLDYLSFLRERGLIIRSEGYDPGGKSYTYNLDLDDQRSPVITVALEDEAIQKRIRIHSFKLFKSMTDIYSDYRHVIYWFTTGKLSIDKDQAINCVEKLNDRISCEILPSSNSITDEAILKLINAGLPNKKKNALISLENLSKKKYDVFVDTKGWRLYSSLTSLMSPLRSYLTYDNQELCSIDLKNSQAFHFSHILTETFWHGKPLKASLQTLQDNIDIAGERSYYKLFQNNGMLKEIRKIIRQSPEDIERFKSLTIAGELYQFLSNAITEKGLKRNLTKEASKQRFIQFLNCDHSKKDKGHYADYRAFEELFPNVVAVMEAMKSHYYTDISFILQRLEAKMLLHYFSSSFAKKYPEIPLFSVHDSIITLKQYKQEAISQIEETYNDVFGFAPTTDGGEDLNHSNAVANLNGYIEKKVITDLQVANLDESFYQQQISKRQY